LAGKLKLELALPEKYFSEKISRAKAQSAAAFLKGFLCAFAGKIFSVEHTFRARPLEL
jgi:hypothetical protein